MLNYLIRRLLIMVVTVFVISIVAFIIIQLPPGDYLTIYMAQLREDGIMDEAVVARMRERYGFGEPRHVQYYKWMRGIILRGDWGHSMYYQRPVAAVVGDRLMLTFVISFATMLFSWLVSIPLGVYSATHQYSIMDYFITALNFIGRGIPQFMIALVVLWWAFQRGMGVGGLFSAEYIGAPWSWGKFVDMLKHIWQPIVILAIGSTAGLTRITRANLLDELKKPYVQTARAKGLSERKLLWKYPVRMCMDPFFSTMGWALASLVSGTTIVAIVLSLQTTGPMLFRALMTQDMYLAGSFILMLSTLTVVGTLISDLILAWVDPRIRLGEA